MTRRAKLNATKKYKKTQPEEFLDFAKSSSIYMALIKLGIKEKTFILRPRYDCKVVTMWQKGFFSNAFFGQPADPT